MMGGMLRKVKHPQYPNYLVRDDGLVERAVASRKYHKAGFILRGSVLQSGYRQFALFDACGVKRGVRANRLVCEAFHGKPPSARYHAAHKDGNRLNNKPENLYWATAKQNKRDSINHGTAVFGEKVSNQHGPAKLDAASVLSIRNSYTGKRGDLARLARQYGVGTTCIKNVVNRSTWGHVKSALDMREDA